MYVILKLSKPNILSLITIFTHYFYIFLYDPVRIIVASFVTRNNLLLIVHFDPKETRFRTRNFQYSDCSFLSNFEIILEHPTRTFEVLHLF